MKLLAWVSMCSSLVLAVWANLSLHQIRCGSEERTTMAGKGHRNRAARRRALWVSASAGLLTPGVLRVARVVGGLRVRRAVALAPRRMSPRAGSPSLDAGLRSGRA